LVPVAFPALDLATLLVLAWITFRFITNPLIVRFGDMTDDTHGSARFATNNEVAPLTQSGTGLLIGRDPKSKNLMRYDGPVHVLDPFGATGMRAAAFNTLDPAEDASTLADALVFDEPGMAGEAHWSEEAKALIAGLLLKIVAGESPGRRHLGMLREYLTGAPETFAADLKRMQDTDAASGLIARAANRHLGKSDRDAAGVLSAAQRHTHFLDSPRMTAVLRRSEFRFADLKRSSVLRACGYNRPH
jgi:type IV secretion system protein VirD4